MPIGPAVAPLAQRQRRAQPWRGPPRHTSGDAPARHPDQHGSHGMQTGCYARPSFSLPLSSSRSCRNGVPNWYGSRRLFTDDGCRTRPPHTGQGWPVPWPGPGLSCVHRTRDATSRVPCAGRLSGWTMHAPAADSNAARRASRMARQTAQMTSSHPDERDRVGGVGSVGPRGTMVMRARCGDGGRIVSRSGAGRGAGVARPAHSSHRRGQ